MKKDKPRSYRTNLSSSRMKLQTIEAKYQHQSSLKKRTGKIRLRFKKLKLPDFLGAKPAHNSTKEAHQKVFSLLKSKNRKKSIQKQWLSRKASKC